VYFILSVLIYFVTPNSTRQ